MNEPDVMEPPPRQRAEPALEYTPKLGPGGPVTVRGIRLLVVLTLVNTTLLGMSVLGPQLFPFLRQQWQQWELAREKERARQAALALQQQCLAHTATPGRLAYEEDPAEAAKLRADATLLYGSLRTGTEERAPPGWVPPATAPVPTYLPQYTDAIFRSRISGMGDPVLFLHGRTTPGGAQHVVCVQLSVQHGFDRKRDNATGAFVFSQVKRRLLVANYWPAGADGPPAARGKGQQRTVDLVLSDNALRPVARLTTEPTVDTIAAIDYGNLLRVYEGQPDPADPSHFTIPYRLDGRDGVIDGWLKDDGLQLRPREGNWSFDAPGQAWKLPAGPSTQPMPPSPSKAGQPQSGQ